MSTVRKLFMLCLLSALLGFCIPALAAEPGADGVLVDTSTYIYAETYKGRDDIKRVSLPNATYIGASAFERCPELVSVEAPQVEAMSGSVFGWCGKLETVSMGSLTSISDSTFVDCKALRNLDIPSVKSVQSDAFINCSALADFPFAQIQTIGSSAFAQCTSLQHVDAPLCQEVNDGAFSECTSLETVNFPILVGDMNNTIFNKCLRLKDVNLPKMETIGSSMFASCSALESLSLPAATRLDPSALADCPSLASLRLDRVQSITGPISCPRLKRLAIPSADYIAANAFQYCTGLNTLVVGGSFPNALEPGTVPNQAGLTIYIPNGKADALKAKITGGTLHVNIVGYDGPVLKNAIFFGMGGGTKSCVLTPSAGTSFAISQGRNASVDANGVVTVSGQPYQEEVHAFKRLDVGGFSDLQVNARCAIRTVGILAYAPSLADGSTARVRETMDFWVYPTPVPLEGNQIQLNPATYPAFTFRSYDEEWYEITYGTNTAYLPKPAVALEGTPDYPDPGPDPYPGGDPVGGGSGAETPAGTPTGEGIKMTININGKDTDVMLSLANFTYDYDQPETVRMIAGFNLRKGPNAAFGTYRNVRKGTPLTIIGRDREWLKVDMGNGKIAYVLEDMTVKQ